MGNWAKYLGFNLFKGHKVIRERDAFAASELFADTHPGFFDVWKGGDWMHPSKITTPVKAWMEGYRQAVRDQRKLMREEYNENIH